MPKKFRLDSKKYPNTGELRNYDPLDHEDYFPVKLPPGATAVAKTAAVAPIDTGAWCYDKFDPCGLS